MRFVLPRQILFLPLQGLLLGLMEGLNSVFVLIFFEDGRRWSNVGVPFSEDVELIVPAHEGLVGEIKEVLIFLRVHFNKFYMFTKFIIIIT